MRALVLVLLVGCAQARNLPGVGAGPVDGGGDLRGAADQPLQDPLAPPDVDAAPLADALGDTQEQRQDAGRDVTSTTGDTSGGPLAPLDASPDACAGLVCNFPLTAVNPYPTCSPRPPSLCLLYVTSKYPITNDEIPFCDFSHGGMLDGMAWEVTANPPAFVERHRAAVCQGRAAGTTLTLESWTYDNDGKHGVRSASTMPCP